MSSVGRSPMRHSLDSIRTIMWLALAVAPAFVLIAVASAASDQTPGTKRVESDEVEVALDMKEVDIRAAVRTLAELGDFQPVFDRDVSCRRCCQHSYRNGLPLFHGAVAAPFHSW